MSKSRTIEVFLSSGEVDPSWSGWGGDAEAGERALRGFLERVLVYRSRGAPLGKRTVPANAHLVLTRRVRPMVTGLFDSERAERILSALPRCMQVATVDGFAHQVQALSLADAWCLANIVLEDMGAPPLSDAAPQLDGLCLGHEMWVPPGAFASTRSAADVLVHEVAHLLHSVPAERLQLCGIGPPIPVPPEQYETFAYACELWACCERQPSPPPGWIRSAVDTVYMADPRVDIPVLRTLLTEAERHGWAPIRTWVDALPRQCREQSASAR